MSVGEAGWLYTDELQRALLMDRTRINLELHRARKLFECHGVKGSDRVVERRPDTQQLRFGTMAVEVVEE